MTIRTKVWLLVAVSAAITVGAAAWLRTHFTRRLLVQQTQAQAYELAKDIVRDLESFDADVDDRDLALRLYGYTERHPRLQRLQLLVRREASSPTSRIIAPRGQQPEITRLGPNWREPEHFFSRKSDDAATLPIELPVDLQGPWQATLSMQYSLGAVESVLAVTERSALLFSAVVLVLLVLLAGSITDRLVVRRLDVLAAAMRDVEAGDLNRRVPSGGSSDEIGRLSQGFNQMLVRLSAADAEIRAFSQRLAREIEAATRDLHEKNSALAQLNRLLVDLRRDNASKVRLATLGQLAAQLAHEIGTPLSSVSGHLQLAMLQRELPPGLRDRLEVASREIGRIGKIVRDYLDSTRSLEPDRKPTALRRLLAEAIDVSRGVDPAPRASIALELDDDPLELVTDPGLLRQVVINLLSNALDAVEARGAVTVRARGDGEHVLVSVSDTGSGIAPDDLRRIFEPFYTTKGRGKGTGLGLAICRELTTALGGTIDVQTTAGRGSTFTVRLPRRPPVRDSESSPRIAIGGAA